MNHNFQYPYQSVMKEEADGDTLNFAAKEKVFGACFRILWEEKFSYKVICMFKNYLPVSKLELAPIETAHHRSVSFVFLLDQGEFNG